MNYKEKLKGFNDTIKYRREEDFLLSLLDPKPGERILDYGCGLGRTVHRLRAMGYDAYGYDVTDYVENPSANYFRRSYHFRFNKIYFMHSIAHVPSIDYTVGRLTQTFLESGGEIVVITPNEDWLLNQSTFGYEPDKSVIRHYGVKELRNLFGRHGFLVPLLGSFGAVDSYGYCERVFLKAVAK